MAYESDDNYSDAAPQGGEQPANEGEGDESEYPRAVLPKSIMMGKDFKPGDEIVLKIDAIHDDEIEVSYAPAKESEQPKEPEDAPAEAPQGDAEMASMME